jgi:hypothetical protein
MQKGVIMRIFKKWSFVVITLLISCNTNETIPEKDMVAILVKIHLIDATTTNSYFQAKYGNKDTIDYYGKTIKSYGYTRSQFDSSLKVYSRNPKEFDAIYDKVIAELSKIETRITAETQFYEDSIATDTLKNLWQLKPTWEIPVDGKHTKIDFEIPVVGLGIYTISADVQIFPDDESIQPSMVGYFYFDDKTKTETRKLTTSKVFVKGPKPQNYSIQLDLRNSLVTHLKGSLISHKNTDTTFIKHAQVSNIVIRYKHLPSKKSTSLKKPKAHSQIDL